MSDFSVIGGGVAGLVLARDLARAGASVTVYEAAARLGGTVASHVVDGLTLDAGAESFAVRGDTVAALLGELGLAGDIVTPHPGPAWLQPAIGEAVPLPRTGLLGIPADIRADDVVRVLGSAAAERAAHADAAPLGEIPATLGALVRDRLGADVLDALVSPVVRGVHSQHPDDLPLERAHPGLRAALSATGSLTAAVAQVRGTAAPGSAVAGIRDGIHRLIPALERDLRAHGGTVVLGARVTDVPSLPGIAVAAAPGVTQPAGPGRRVTLVTLVVEQPALDAAPRGTGLLVDEAAPVDARALTHATAKWAWLRDAAEGRHVLRLSYDAAPAQPIDTAIADAQTLLGVPLTQVRDAAVVTWTRPAPAAPIDGLPLVGETVAGSGLAGIIAHARRTAAGLVAPPPPVG
ncbi:NAD(P)/FAD-dependent oxidoreductase [Microbacterium sp. C7(2022)]|uniref:protoporphyrinogen/coproporphyrinogen oxidase n=1 Tax=Microbacterium sp. C7(2022) TaxID=2992759 RepID=UPI00237AE2EC|nr:FAD-dependent oxidoreductase [Microbacterium sp. C7(2022)]MDE0547077.1 FAD-dependent oxidoreductase [Microbacterium sp. C7(2022)]